MKVKRIVRDVKSTELEQADRFYRDILGMELLMDMGWIRTYGAPDPAPVQLTVASQGGSDTEVPDLSIEVDDLETAIQRVELAGLPFEYGPVSEPWGVRRFYVRDPFGQLVNILQHQ